MKKCHNCKVGDVVILATGSKGYLITVIAPTADDTTSDDFAVDTALGTAAKAGDSLYLAPKAGASGSAFKYAPVALVGESYDVDELSNHIVNAWTIGQIRESNIPPIGAEVKAKLTGIQFI